MFERVNEQIKLIEQSSQYRKEKAQNNSEVSSVQHGGTFGRRELIDHVKE